jgi:hypothetical protein
MTSTSKPHAGECWQHKTSGGWFVVKYTTARSMIREPAVETALKNRPLVVCEQEGTGEVFVFLLDEFMNRYEPLGSIR